MHVGIDVGGTKLEIIALNKNGEILYGKRVATPQGQYEATLRAILELVSNLERELGPAQSVGIGTPGSLDKREKIKNANSTCLNGKPLKHDLGQLLQRPFALENDANCLILSEAQDGAAEDYRLAFGAILGTGTGGGICFAGNLLSGANHLGGEWGHNPLPWINDNERPGAPCYCGKQACIETFLSGPGFQRNHYSQYGQNISSEQIVERAQNGDLNCIESLNNYYDQLARSLAHVINIIDPEIIVLGGGMSNIKNLYEELPLRVAKYVFAAEYQLNVCAAKFGDASGVRGAAWLGKMENSINPS